MICFIPDLVRMLDNVLEHFIQNAPDQLSRAKYSAMRERSIGLGAMGFSCSSATAQHSFRKCNGKGQESTNV